MTTSTSAWPTSVPGVMQFADFPAMGLPHRPAQHSEVLGEDVHRAAAYLTPASDDTVAQCAPLGQAKAVP